ncbi:MAG TPA: response regulator [bacterium]
MTDKILVVDEDQILRGLYQTELQEEGYRVTTAAGGHEAVDKLNHEAVDLVVLELELHDGSGLDYLQQLMNEKRNLKVIINTDYPTYKMDFRSWAADAFLVKTPDLDQLKETIDNLLHKSE